MVIGALILLVGIFIGHSIRVLGGHFYSKPRTISSTVKRLVSNKAIIIDPEDPLDRIKL